MNSKLILSASFAAILAAGCASNSNSDFALNAQPYTNTKSSAAMTDARVIGAVEVLNKNEIAAANVAEAKSTNPAVKKYASAMIQQHTQNLQQTENLSAQLGLTPANGPVANMLKSNGKRELAQFNRLNSTNIDRPYMTAMVKDHAAALKLLDTKLMHQAANPALKQQLEMTRAHVAQHLQMAQDTLAQLSN